MRALVVYESSFGNTGQVAEAVWEGMRRRLPDVALLDVASAPHRLPPELELLVVGAPTQAFGMSRPSTREDALRTAGREPVGPTIGVREWLRELAPPERPVHAATFDTRIHTPHVPGSAAVGAWRVLRREGFQVSAEAESFWVLGIRGPLRDGELDRARSWGVGLAGLVLEPVR
ncbi:flavodoxin/nitric oxide synthase [Cellulomonas xylanilytica]|uniref:Flavodoxin n=1 Tax=Cellulomonas xylanilytica TaxID=233583 RepID=A0A510UYU6_9CELL|nr:flavodoxin/nitric oxide synthase [Cellulomonas xylanilytica]GEK19843.1 flavodoxin [Cellulomonas xylanilytica]